MESGRNVKGKVIIIMPSKSKGIGQKKFKKEFQLEELCGKGGRTAGIYPAPSQLGIRVSRGKARKQSYDLSSSRMLPGGRKSNEE